ncbi:hypothetical protein BFJ68_g16271 [Fusarium oxysporum]|uniref:Uncharacterized protein n=1 Tax=Fusarium oxysporum TaxID=5507 RepID=A0A420PF22_FUSOX|nr:hypothetical protein BFJ71_g14054 [Fusarium oxysporum]RKK91130.1 hypothetical protein BFJ68_g16271 [Fusarium oxysporum]
MSQLQLILEHVCFIFGQREMQKELDKWGWSCAEAAPLHTWIHLIKQSNKLEHGSNTESLPGLFSSVSRIQDIVTHPLGVELDEVDGLLLSAEEFVRLLDIVPTYRSAIKPLREHIEGVLRTVNRNVASTQREAGKKFAQIEEQRKRLKRQEEEVERDLQESLDSIRSSIEREVFVAMRQAKEVLPDIGLAEQYCKQ